jgi:pyrroline-5-carboxylate reductase
MSASETEVQSKKSAQSKAEKKIAILGCGKMGTILLQGFMKHGLINKGEAVATVQHEEHRRELARELPGVAVSTDNRTAVSGAPVVLLAVKPQVLPQVLDEIAPVLVPETLLISIAASTTTRFIQQHVSNHVHVVRAMPNTPAMVGAAMTALCAGATARKHHMEMAKSFFESVGRAVIVDEKHMDAITLRKRPGLRLRNSGIHGRRRCESGIAAGAGHHTGGADAFWRRQAGAGNRPSSCAAQRRRHHACRLHHRRAH